jgi:transposase InsO family protein
MRLDFEASAQVKHAGSKGTIRENNLRSFLAEGRLPAKCGLGAGEIVGRIGLLFGLLIMGHGRRHILWFGVTAHPTAEWIANQITQARGWEQTPRYLIRDRDGAYGEIFIQRLRSMGIRDRPTSPRSPWQNGYAEGLIGSVRRECIDHVVVFGERHLRHIMLSYMKYYNEVRTHLSLEKDAPISRAVDRAGHILCRPVLGGLHHQYVRI